MPPPSITQSLKLCEQRNLIYSGEAISLLDINSIGEIKETLKKHTNEIKVICYFRDPESHAQSAWQETIKNGVNASSPQQPNYREKLEKFIHVFGEKNIVLKHFSKDKLFENDVVSDFFKTCGISQKKNTPRQNNALSTEAIKCIYILNKIISPLDGDKHSNIARDHFIETVTTLFPGKFHVPAGMLSEAINEEDCKWMEQISGTKLLRATEYLNTTNCQDPNQYFSELLPQTIDSMLNHLNINVDLNRDSAKIVNRLYLECFSKIMPKTIEFSADRYLERNPDVKNAGVNPYEHYLTFGCREGRLLK